MAGIILGRKTWSSSADDEGHREYKYVFKIEANTTDGPATIRQTPGLPLPGSFWSMDGDTDVWAWCKFNDNVTQVIEDEPNTLWLVEKTFTTKPPPANRQRCQDFRVEDPVLEPAKLRGGLSKYTEEATKDRFGRRILNSAFEQIRGPQAEFDANRDTVSIEQNVLDLQLPLLVAMRDTVSDSPMWGLPARCVKLSNYTWEPLYYGNCYKYYKRTLEFETYARPDPTWEGSDTPPLVSGFDRDVLDEGTKVLNGRWGEIESLGTASGGSRFGWILSPMKTQTQFQPEFGTGTGSFATPASLWPDPENPNHFIRAVDKAGNTMRMVLNGRGLPAGVPIQFGGSSGYFDDAVDGTIYDPGSTHIEKYPESNFFLLGVPAFF